MAANRTFSDIDFNLTIHDGSKDVLKVYDANAVYASVKHLVLTEFYGRPFHPEIGSSVAGLLFELWTPALNKAVEVTIEDVINNNEPRATVKDVRARYEDGESAYYVDVDIFLNALMQQLTVDLILQRVR